MSFKNNEELGLLDLAAERAKACPERTALCVGDDRYRYADLNQRAERLAGLLWAHGVRQGDRVVILAPNQVAHIDLMLAAPKLGFFYTPLNTRLGAAEIAALIARLRPAFALVDHDGVSFACPARQLDDTYDAWLAGACAPPPAPVLSEDHPWMVFGTGGSSGQPKSALLPYRQVLGNARVTIAAWGLNEDDCAIHPLSCAHAAFNVLVPSLLMLGACVVLMRQFDATEYLAQLQRHRATLMFLVPTTWRMLAESPACATADFSHVRFAISGGAPLPPALAAQWRRRGIPLRQGFGMTEAGVNCFAISAEDAQRHAEIVGRPLLDAQIRRADGSLCDAGEVGELHFSGPMVCAGYFEREDEWRRSFRDGWFATGDLAERDADGLFYIRGRSKEMYISGGENVYLQEVEAALASCDGVADCAVVGVPDAHWGETGLAAVVLRAGAQADAAALRRELRTRLSAYKLPSYFWFMDALPLLGSGKLARSELRRRWLQKEAA